MPYSYYDLLVYGYGTDVSEYDARLGTFTGDHANPEYIPSPFTVTRDSAWFFFESDSRTNYKGFNLTWDATGNV